MRALGRSLGDLMSMTPTRTEAVADVADLSGTPRFECLWACCRRRLRSSRRWHARRSMLFLPLRVPLLGLWLTVLVSAAYANVAADGDRIRVNRPENAYSGAPDVIGLKGGGLFVVWSGMQDPRRLATVDILAQPFANPLARKIHERTV